MTVCGCHRPPDGVATPSVVSSAAIAREDIPRPFMSASSGAKLFARSCAAALFATERFSAPHRPSFTPRAFAACSAPFVRAETIQATSPNCKLEAMRRLSLAAATHTLFAATDASDCEVEAGKVVPPDAALSAPIIGSGSAIKAGTGTLTLSGASTFSGGTTIDAGTLSLAVAGAAGTGDITFAGTGDNLDNLPSKLLENCVLAVGGAR